MTCTRRSGLMLAKPPRMALMAPECFSVLSSKIAPKMIHNTAPVRIRPCSIDAMTRLTDMPQALRAITTLRISTAGMARLAGQLKPTSSTAASTSGAKASKESKV